MSVLARRILQIGLVTQMNSIYDLHMNIADIAARYYHLCHLPMGFACKQCMKNISNHVQKHLRHLLHHPQAAPCLQKGLGQGPLQSHWLCPEQLGRLQLEGRLPSSALGWW